MSSNAIGQRPKERTARTPKTKNRTHPRLEKFVKDFLLHPAPPASPIKQLITDNNDSSSKTLKEEHNVGDSKHQQQKPSDKNNLNDACQNNDAVAVAAAANLIDNATNSDKSLNKNPIVGHNKDDTLNKDSSQAASASTTEATKSNQARPASPLTNQCPICLANIKTEDTSFTNTCFHSFCYTCIDEWTKVKTQCPVCRTDFTKIIYKVKSETNYEEKPARAPRRPEALFSGRSFMDSFRIELSAPQDHHAGNSYHYSVQVAANQLGFQQSLLQSMLDYDPRPHSGHRSRNTDRYSGMYSQAHTNSTSSAQPSHSTSSRVNASTNTPASNNTESRRRHSSRVSSMRMRAHSNAPNQEPRSDNPHMNRDPRLDNHNYAQIAFNRQMRERIAILEDNIVGSESARLRHYHTRHIQTPGFRPCPGQIHTSSSNSNVRRSTRSRARTQASTQHICTPTDILNSRQSNLGGFGQSNEYSHSGESRINNMLVQHSSLYTDRFNDFYQLDTPYNERNPLLLSNPILLSQLTETIPQDMVSRVPYIEPSSSTSRPNELHPPSAPLVTSSSIGGNPSASLLSAITLNGLLHPPYNRTSPYMQGPNDFTTPPPLEDISLNIPPIVAHRTSSRAPPPPLLDNQDQLSTPAHSSETNSRNQALNMAHQRVRSSDYSLSYPQLYQQSASPSFHPSFSPENWREFLTSPQNYNQPELPIIPSRIEEPNSVRAHDRQSTLDRQNSSRQACSIWSGPPRIVSNRYRSNKRQRTSVACRPVEFINLSGSEDEDDTNGRREPEQPRNDTTSHSGSNVAYVQLDNPQPSTSGTQTTEKRNSKRKKTSTSCRNVSSSRNVHGGEPSSCSNLRADNIGSRLSSPENDCDNESSSQCHLVNNPSLSRNTGCYNSDDSSEVEIVDCLKPIPERDHDVIDLEDD